MAHLTVGMRLEGTKGSIVKAMEYMQMQGIKFIHPIHFCICHYNSICLAQTTLWPCRFLSEL